jgi:hypothetical protein
MWLRLYYRLLLLLLLLLTYLLTYLLIPWNRNLLEKLPGLQLVKKFPAFYGTLEPESSLPQSQVPATCPYPESAQSSPYPYIHCPFIYAWVSYPQVSHQNPVHASPLPHTRYMPRPYNFSIIIIIIIIIVMLLLLLLMLLSFVTDLFFQVLFSWTNGDPLRSGLKFQTAVLSVCCVMFIV